MAERTFESEKERLIEEGADSLLFDIDIIKKLFVGLINNPVYGTVNEVGEAEITHADPETGTFDLRTRNINGHTMLRFADGNIQLRKVEITHHKRVIDLITDKPYSKRREDIITIDKDGNIIEQSWYSTRKHGCLV